MLEATAPQDWRAARYEANAGFVADLGEALLDVLDPQPGERVLDLGCGDGRLTEKLAARGCEVVAIDAAPDMVRAARERGLDADVGDAHALAFTAEFDAVFSNAALHWMKRPRAVAGGVRRALRPGGRFVGEMGGHGDVAAIKTALLARLAARGVDGEALIPWYFPTPAAYGDVLEGAGFDVASMVLIPRPTPLPTDMAGWLATFCDAFSSALPAADRPAYFAEVVALLRPSLCDETGRWTADYVRLRFRADLA